MRVGRAGKRAEKIIGVVAVVAVVLTGGSYWTGLRVEQGFREGMDWAAKQGFEVSLVDYNREIFGATARTDVVFQVPSGEDLSITDKVSVPVVHTIRHGPFSTLTAAARIHSEIEQTKLSEEDIAQLNKVFDEDTFWGKTPPVVKTVIGWWGGLNFHAVSPKFEAVIKDVQVRETQGGSDGKADPNSSLVTDIVIGGPSFIRMDENVIKMDRVAVKGNMILDEQAGRGYTGTMDIVLNKLHFQGKDDTDTVRGIELENLHITADASTKGGVQGRGLKFDIDKVAVESGTKDDESILRASRVAFKSDMALVEGFERVYTGTTNITLGTIHFQGKGDSGVVRTIDLDNFRVTADASVKDGALDTGLKFDADKITVEGEEKETVENPKLVFLWENIDAKAFDLTLQAMLDGREEQEQVELMLWRRSPAFSIKDASARWAEGMVTGSFRIAYAGNGKDSGPSMFGASGDFQLVLPPALSGDLQLEVPRALVIRHISSQASVEIADSLEDGEENEVNVEEETKKLVEKRLTAMLEKGIFVEKGETLTVDAHLRNSKLTINGKPQQIENLFELVPPFF